MRPALALPFLWLLPCFLSAAAETPMLLLYAPALTPDGKSFAFEWNDDIWLASSTTGEAKRIIDAPGRDMFPRITPDAKRVVFTSDRSGSPQIYSAPLTGGDTTQHTFHTEGCQLECLSPDGSRALVRGLRDRSGYKPWRLMEIDLTRPSRERRLFDATAHSPAYSPDGTRILICRGGELPYRRGFHGSRSSRIWSFEKSTHHFTQEIPGDFEARSPLWLPDGSGFYFASNENGTANLWIKKSGKAPRQLTFHQDQEVLGPGLSQDGSTLIYRLGFDLVRIDTAKPDQPHTFRAFTRESLTDHTSESIPITGCLHADITVDLSQLVFSEAGELWHITAPGEKSVRLTHTPAAEESPRFSPDGSWLYFLSDDGLTSSICRARIRDRQLTDITTLVSDHSSKSTLTPSPCGNHIAWIEARGDLRIADADGSHPHTVFPCWDKPTFSWSPDGNWLVVAAKDANANRDLHLVPVAAGRPAVNLTRHPAFDGSPQWSPDGRRIVFTSKRSSSGHAELWCMDFGKAGIGENPSPEFLHQCADAARPLSTRGIEPHRVLWSHHPQQLYFQSRNSSNTRLYQLDVTKESMTTASETNGIPARVTRQGALLWRTRRIPQVFQNGKLTSFPIQAEITRSRPDFLRLGFRRIWRTLGERFHDPTMNGRDWNAIRQSYEPIAAASRTSREFDHIIGRLLGELNASHLVFQRAPWPGESTPTKLTAQTLHPGIRFTEPSGRPNTPLTIATHPHGVPHGAPHGAPALVDNLPLPQPGETVLRIAGQPVLDDTPLEPLFHGSPGMQVPIVLRDASGRERTLSLNCQSYAQARALDTKAKLDLATARATAQPGTAYLHLRNMSDDSLQKLQLFVHRASSSHTALVLDLRDNGGGREANRMLSIFQQPIPFSTRPRNGPDGYPHDRLPITPWPHRVCVLSNENTYSNSEIFCHAFLLSQRGPLVGSPTAGGVISAVMTDIPGLGKLQVPFRTWHHPSTGKSLELNGAQPTHHIPLTPADEDADLDPQLQKALDLLVK